MLYCCVQWHMRQVLIPLTEEEEEKAGNERLLILLERFCVFVVVDIA